MRLGHESKQHLKGEAKMKIGFLSVPLAGHLYPMATLARTLQSRGHEVLFIGVPDAEMIVRGAGVDFVSYCEDEYPLGSIPKAYAPAGKMHGLEVTTYTCQEIVPRFTEAAFRHLPRTLRRLDVDLLVIDTIHFLIELVPMNMGIPYIQMWNVVHLDLSGKTPPSLFDWPHETTAAALARNQEASHELVELLFPPVMKVALRYATQHGMQIDWMDPGATASKLAILSQIPEAFDFPGTPWPPQHHYTGPLHDVTGRSTVEFPWELLDDRPLIYASMGTLLNGSMETYRIILNSAAQFPESQFVVSVGNAIRIEDLGEIPKNVIAVNKAPQLELLQRATLCITHAGLNTVLESLAQGVPMVAIPVGYDQPGTAARIAHYGVGEFVRVEEELSSERLTTLIKIVLHTSSYRENARKLQLIIEQARGLDVAADVVETACMTVRVPASY
jgi:zeaxanthin glucosyltransferase